MKAKLTFVIAITLSIAAFCWAQVNSTTGRSYTGQSSQATVVSLGRTTALGATNLVASASAVQYTVRATLRCTTTSAAATVNVIVRWTDAASDTAQSSTLASAAACTAIGAASFGSLPISFVPKAGTAITVETGIVNTPTYDIRAALLQDTSS